MHQRRQQAPAALTTPASLCVTCLFRACKLRSQRVGVQPGWVACRKALLKGGSRNSSLSSRKSRAPQGHIGSDPWLLEPHLHHVLENVLDNAVENVVSAVENALENVVECVLEIVL